MAVRPKTRQSNGGGAAQPLDDLSCGYVMHQYKSLRSKMRWGQLWTGEDETGLRKCVIRLFKFDIINPKPGTFTKKDLKLKVSFEFKEEDFCGLEKGEHYTKNGMRRYICIILRDKHLIVQDAVTAMTDTDHNVIGTWYRKISETMYYVNRWKVYGNETDVKFLHVSRENVCECFSLHNSHAGQKGKLLLANLYKTRNIRSVYELQEMHDNELLTRLTFYDQQRGLDVKISFFVYGLVKLAEILQKVAKNQLNIRPTLCPRFDDLNINTNLVKLPPEKRKPKEASPMNLKQLSDVQRIGSVNPYVIYDPPDGLSQANQRPAVRGVANTPVVPVRPPFTNPVYQGESNAVTPEQGRTGSLEPMRFSANNPFASANGIAPRPHSTRGDNPPAAPPRDPSDEPDVQKKLPDPVTQRSCDSDYQTGETFNTLSTTSATEEDARLHLSTSNATPNAHILLENYEGPYLNVLSSLVLNPLQSNIPAVEYHQGPGLQGHDESPGQKAEPAEAPIIPPRESQNGRSRVSEDDPVRRAIESQQLPPIDTNQDSARPGYENNLRIEVTIGEIMERSHLEVQGRTLGLPYSVYMALILGLEKDSVANGNWRGLASALCMTLQDVEQIESTVHTHPHLLPAQIVLLHWQRVQAPHPFTRTSLKWILQDIMGRLDLASLIPLDEEGDKGEADQKVLEKWL